MENALVIVESPSKASTIKGYLGKGYKVLASYGHIRDLPKSKFGIDIDDDFKPGYINIRGKGEVINALKSAAKQADVVYLATDPDREGEAISWHLATALNGSAKKTGRITFNEVTKSAIKAAVKNPREINMDLVDSQQTRRILDRIVGYKISPLLWKNIKSGLSAGRVQSVTTRLIIDREDEIAAFKADEYWNINALLIADGKSFTAKLVGKNGEKLVVDNAESAQKVYDELSDAQYSVISVKKAVKQRKAMPPLITSTLTQEANKKYSFQSQRTMKTAQELYEGLSLGDKGAHGLITYMRTDSLRVSDEARDAAKSYIMSAYGEQYYPKTPNVYKSRQSSQDAHEAIRPTNVFDTPQLVAGKLSADQLKIYTLIWERFVASQMANALLDTVIVDINAAGYDLRAGGYTVRFNGFTILSQDRADDNQGDDELIGGKLPELTQGDKCQLDKLTKEQKFTQPPAHYNEASLIKTLEEKGIGRPSTYAPTISTIISREYIVRDGRALLPTQLARETNDLMKKFFPEIVDYSFTAKMEEDLDKVEQGEKKSIDVLNEFYGPFSELLAKAEKTEREKKEPEITDLVCPNCGRNLVVKSGRFGRFAACPGYPECHYTVKLDANGKAAAKPEEKEEVLAEEKCEQCGKDMVLRSGRYGQFYACKGYPECKNTRPILNEIGVPCPKCGKTLVYKKGKKRYGFYACSGYPECDFSCWDTPTTEKCPQCGAMLLKNKQKKLTYCSKSCGYSVKDSE
ncbi:MAG TPA: type I DNA topoisomerase [Bacillota bacterium]|nr:type I DNA topoisomerase [Bacillota bacterium]